MWSTWGIVRLNVLNFPTKASNIRPYRENGSTNDSEYYEQNRVMIQEIIIIINQEVLNFLTNKIRDSSMVD